MQPYVAESAPSLSGCLNVLGLSLLGQSLGKALAYSGLLLVVLGTVCFSVGFLIR